MHNLLSLCSAIFTSRVFHFLHVSFDIVLRTAIGPTLANICPDTPISGLFYLPLHHETI